jgi:hypothetical protein
MMKTSLTARSSVFHGSRTFIHLICPLLFPLLGVVLPYRIAAVPRRFFLDAKALL